MKNVFAGLAMMGLLMGYSANFTLAHAETAGSKMDEAVNDTKRGTGEAVDTVKDKGCELVNGKMDCAAKKVKHKAKKVKNKAADALD